MFAASKTASVSGGYQISRSLRFNSADSAYLNRTPATTTNRRTWTWSGWVKRGKIGDWAYLFQGSAGNPTGGLDDGTAIRFSSTNNPLVIYNLYNSASTVEVSTAALFRDPSAWYHIIVAMDTTQATSTDRVKVYVNGVQAALNAGGVYPTLNEDLYVNTTNSHLIGALTRDGGGAQLFNDGYMTEVNFIDGQALTPSSFGETNAQTGVWQPKAYSGSYGTNGFYLNFSDNSNTTAATLGKDYSGNGNNFTPNNFSVTAGAGNDSMVDSPTQYGFDTGVGGTVRGNYATLNPLRKSSAAVLSNGNLNVTSSGASTSANVTATISPSSGYYYWEMTCAGSNASRPWSVGFASSIASSEAGPTSADTFVVSNGTGSLVYYYVGASLTSTLSTTSTWTAGDVISVAWDATSTANKFWVGINGVWYPSVTGGTVATNADVAAGNNPTFSISNVANTNPLLLPLFVSYGSAANADVNFGQRPFTYTAPSGFKALCTQNLPTPTIGATTATQAGKFFNPVLYTGTGSNLAVTGVGFQPDFIWTKSRSAVDNHVVVDAVRGIGNILIPNSTGAASTYNAFNSFDSDGFTKSSLESVNGRTYVAWNWKANGSGSTNTSGSITSTVSANTTSGFSVVTYTGVTPWPQTIGHGLGVAPSMIIIKNRSMAGTGWAVYHSALGNTKGILLNSTAAAVTDSGFWNNTTPTSSVFTTGNGYGYFVNAATDNYVAYCFAEVAGYSAFGSYTGNGSSDGPFVYTGFRPAYVMFKRTDVGGENWQIRDAVRDTYNVVNKNLRANLSDAETTFDTMDMVSNGFKLRSNDSGINGSGGTYIYMAFASAPLKFSLAR